MFDTNIPAHEKRKQDGDPKTYDGQRSYSGGITSNYGVGYCTPTDKYKISGECIPSKSKIQVFK